jgi:hypothetical protein
MKAGRLEASLDYLGWQFAAGCVLDVFRENQRPECNPTARKASAARR